MNLAYTHPPTAPARPKLITPSPVLVPAIGVIKNTAFITKSVHINAVAPATMCQTIRLPPMNRRHMAATKKPTAKQITVIGISEGKMPKSSTVIDKRVLSGTLISSDCKLDITDWVENKDPMSDVTNAAPIKLIMIRMKLGIALLY